MVIQWRVMLAVAAAPLSAAPLSAAPAIGATPAYASATAVAGAVAPTSQAVEPTGYPGRFVNVLDATFGTARPDATVRDKADLDRIAYDRYIYGDAATTGDGTDGLYSNYRSRHRDYPQGDPRSLHVFTPDALVLKAHCGLETSIRTDCSDGNIESGIVRFALPIRPGSFIEIRCGMPPAPYAWPAFWLNPGEELPPDHPGGKPRFSKLAWPPEIDIFDQFGFNGVKPGHYLISRTPTGGHDAKFGNPHDTFRAPDFGDKWYYQPEQDLTQGFHTYGFDWGRDNILSFLLDGQVYKRSYYEWNSVGNVPAHLIASLQVGAKFNDLSHITDQGGIAHGWDWPIDYIRVWKDAP
jgi:hypothetical protein